MSDEKEKIMTAANATDGAGIARDNAGSGKIGETKKARACCNTSGAATKEG